MTTWFPAPGADLPPRRERGPRPRPPRGRRSLIRKEAPAMIPEIHEEIGRGPSRLNRRAVFRSTLAAAGAAAVAGGAPAATADPQAVAAAADARRASPKTYRMKK